MHVSVKRFNLCVAQPSPFFVVVHTFTNLQTFISSACNTDIGNMIYFNLSHSTQVFSLTTDQQTSAMNCKLVYLYTVAKVAY